METRQDSPPIPNYGIMIGNDSPRVIKAFQTALPYLETAWLNAEEKERADLDEAIKTFRDLLLRIETEGRESLYDE